MTTTLIAAAVLLLISVLASKASSRFGVPALLLFLAIGMLAGSEGPGGIYFNDVGAAQSLGVLALAFILFSGGLLRAKRIDDHPTGRQVDRADERPGNRRDPRDSSGTKLRELRIENSEFRNPARPLF